MDRVTPGPPRGSARDAHRRQGNSGLLRVDFGEPEASLEEIDWDDFFDTFDTHELTFLYQDKTASGDPSRFHKFVSRDSVDDDT